MAQEEVVLKLLLIGRDLKTIQSIQKEINLETPSEIVDLIETLRSYVNDFGFSFCEVVVDSTKYAQLVQETNDKIAKFIDEPVDGEIEKLKAVRAIIVKFHNDGLLGTKDASTSSADFSDTPM